MQYIKKTHYGIPVDEMEKYYPELVYTTNDGKKGINYTEMIPLLLQSIKELNAKIEDLENKLGTK